MVGRSEVVKRRAHYLGLRRQRDLLNLIEGSYHDSTPELTCVYPGE